MNRSVRGESVKRTGHCYIKHAFPCPQRAGCRGGSTRRAQHGGAQHPGECDDGAQRLDHCEESDASPGGRGARSGCCTTAGDVGRSVTTAVGPAAVSADIHV